MAVKDILSTVRPWAEKYAQESGCVVWDIKFIKEGGEWILRVILDTTPPGNVDLTMCENVNRALDKKLDELDPIEQSYVLEVSSPGINRELYRESDFDLFIGSMIDINLFSKDENGNKNFTAKLIARDGDQIIINDGSGDRKLLISMMSQCRIHDDFVINDQE